VQDEQRIRIYANIARRLVWERRAYIALWCLAGFMAGFGVGWEIGRMMG
jgi:hypothetical protein